MQLLLGGQLDPEAITAYNAALEEKRQAAKGPARCTPEQLEENADGTLTFKTLPGDPNYHDPEEKYTYRKKIGWTTKAQAGQRFHPWSASSMLGKTLSLSCKALLL